MSTYNGFPGKVKFSKRTPAQIMTVVVIIDLKSFMQDKPGK